MRIRDIAFNNIRRRKTKVSFLLAGLMVGVATVVALVSITATLNADIEEKLDRRVVGYFMFRWLLPACRAQPVLRHG